MLDDKTFDIYKQGLTCTINQADSEYATPLVMRYSPKNVSEMSAFVAIIRPGCASLLHNFIDRNPYTTGVSELDNILVEGNHRMVYQELIMKYLIWLGIPETGSYDIIKKIAKKKFKEQELAELKEKLLHGWMVKVGKEEGFAETWKVVEQAAHYSFNACVSGDTVIQRAGAKGHWEPTIEEMYNIMNNHGYALKTGHISLRNKFRSYGYGNALSMFSDGKVRKNKIINIYDSGIAPIYRVKTKNGSYLDCTLNHKFPTPNGKKELSELSIGDLLYVKGTYEKCKNKYRFTDGNFESNIPKLGEKGFQRKPDGNSMLFQSTKNEYKDNQEPCSVCGKPYNPSVRFELHHVDMDRTNNSSENLQWLCSSCHKKAHYNSGRRKMYDKGIPTCLSEIISIEYLRNDHVYDIEMGDPAHTFISASGLITSNSHSLSYAYDSLYGAYLKSHYPLEYYTVAFNYYGDDAARTARLKDELKYFGISLKSPRFRYSKSDYMLSRDDNSIYKGVSSIKGLNDDCADFLYSLRDKQYKCFVELLYDLEGNKKITKTQMTPLIELDFFSEFGDPNLLMEQYLFYKKFNDKKQIKKEVLRQYGLEEDQVAPFAEKVTAKTFMNVDMRSFIMNVANSLHYRKQSVREKVDSQMVNLGYIDISDDRFKNVCYVLDVNTKYSPRLSMYSLRTGENFDCKVDKRTFQKNKLEIGDIVRIINKEPKPKTRKNEFGKFEPIPGTSELWLKKYDKIENI